MFYKQILLKNRFFYKIYSKIIRKVEINDKLLYNKYNLSKRGKCFDKPILSALHN